MFFMSEGDEEGVGSQENPMAGGGGEGVADGGFGGFDSFLWGGELEKAADDVYVSETGEPEYGPTGEDLQRITHTQSELGPLMKKAVPEGHVMRCIVKREKGFISEDIVLCVQEPGKWEVDKKSHRVLLAQKKKKSSTLNIHINLPEIMGRQRLAKIRSLDKKEFTFFDDGTKKDRKELGSGKVTTAGPTKPITLDVTFKNENGLFIESVSLETVKPKHNKEKNSYYLPFERVGERVTMNSRHNFLMKKAGETAKKKKKPMQLGKVEHGQFALDVRAPLSPLQAFLIVMCHIQE